MAGIRNVNDLRFYPLFAVVLVVLAIAMSRVVNVAAERTLLRKLYPSTQPLRVTNNDGTLSNGDKLHGWRKTTFFAVSGVAWMVVCGTATIVLLRVWPAKPEPDPQPPAKGN